MQNLYSKLVNAVALVLAAAVTEVIRFILWLERFQALDRAALQLNIHALVLPYIHHLITSSPQSQSLYGGSPRSLRALIMRSNAITYKVAVLGVTLKIREHTLCIFHGTPYTANATVTALVQGITLTTMIMQKFTNIFISSIYNRVQINSGGLMNTINKPPIDVAVVRQEQAALFAQMIL